MIYSSLHHNFRVPPLFFHVDSEHKVLAKTQPHSEQQDSART